jgi:hypothetical protein
MKIVKAIAILLFVPLLGVLVAFFVGAVALPPDPNFVNNGGHSAPGDGFAIMGFIFLSLVISVPLSIWLAVRVALRKPAGLETRE